MAALINRETRLRLKQPRTAVLLGVELSSAKEEAFCLMVMDGMSIAMAFTRAGFKSKASNAPSILFQKPHIQARAQAILEARRTQGVITLPEVTDMLKRVFAGALHDAEYSAAHNAAFSLARIYGHVTDRATLEVIRRPSRDPDAPSEQALSSWVDALPGIGAPDTAGFVRLSDSPASLLGHDAPVAAPDNLATLCINSAIAPDNLATIPDNLATIANTSQLDAEKMSDINWLDDNGTGIPGRPENGAPTEPVTEASGARAHSQPLGDEGTTPVGGQEKGAPRQDKQVPVLTGEYPPIEDLF